MLASNGVPSTLAATNAIINATTINIDPGALCNLVNSIQLVSNIFNNAGTVVWSNTFGNNITLIGAATFNNLPGGTFIEADNEGGIWQAAQPLQSVFNNFGTFRIASGTNTTYLGVYSMLFNNMGLLDVQSGNAILNNNIDSGQFNVAAGAT